MAKVRKPKWLYVVYWYNEKTNYTEFTEVYSDPDEAQAAADKYEATYPEDSGIKFVAEQIEFIN